MARIKYSALVTSINGSMGGTTFQNNRYGSTIKNKPLPTKPSSSYQFTQKATMQAVSGYWASLTDADRAAWQAWATTYPQRASKNAASYLSGYNLFLKYHLNLALVSPSSVVTQPIDAPLQLGVIDTQIVNDAGDLRWIFDGSLASGSWYVLLYLSRAVQATNSLQKLWTRYIVAQSYSGTALDVSITNAYQARMGDIPAIGDILAMDITFLQQNSGYVFYYPKAQIVVE